MAATNDKLKQITTQQPAATAQQVQKPAQQVTPYTGLAGVSDSTQSMLGKYGTGYTPSEKVSQAQSYLQQVVSGKPGAYQSSYKQQLDDLYSQVMNRPQFSYNMGADPLYHQYRDQYMNLGQQAMMDATAQAAALTGGYGNSYAATAGNQAYQGYLQQLNNVAPELYQMAMQRYQQEGDDLNTRYAMTSDLEETDYSRYQDDMSRWQAERDYASGDYWNQYNADYGQYSDMMNYWRQMAAQENAQWNADRDMAYSQAMAVLKTGKLPDSALLSKAQITKSDAKKLAAYYGRKSGGSSGGKSTSKKTSSSTTVKKTSSTAKADASAGSSAATAAQIEKAIRNAKAASGGGAAKALNMTR